ncbi:MAG: hypothetical protein KDK99_09210 [Verrucomicrobiales bacterium]|nr:hypothetical protein [Verrucomicrobiales bacterium]
MSRCSPSPRLCPPDRSPLLPLLQALALPAALLISACSLPQEYLETGHLPEVRPALPAPATALPPTPPQEPAVITDAGGLELSDQVIPFEKFARGREEELPTLTERFDDLLFSVNRERRDLIEQRSLDDTDTELPERRSLFGGDRFLSPGPIDPGIVLPTKATWRPYFTAFGTLRSGLQTFHQGSKDITEWANRLDIFGNLYLTGTERILIGFRPLDYEGRFSGYSFGGSKPQGWVDELNLEPRTLFFEGDFGELFPFLDPKDRHHLDYQFSIGRQPFVLQDGLLANDIMDAFAVTRHNIYMLGASNSRITAIYAFNDIHRGNNIEDPDARLFALSTTLDYPHRTFETDAAWVTGSPGSGDGAFFGLGHRARFGHWSSTLRANASWALRGPSPAVDTGYLLTHEFSRNLRNSEDIFYFNTLVGSGHYTSAARGPANGGPLGSMGLLNRAVGLGAYGAPLKNSVGDTIAAAIGLQHFFDPEGYRNILVELGARGPWDGQSEKFTTALGAQYQQGFARGMIFTLGGFTGIDEDGDTSYGARTELLLKF